MTVTSSSAMLPARGIAPNARETRFGCLSASQCRLPFGETGRPGILLREGGGRLGSPDGRLPERNDREGGRQHEPVLPGRGALLLFRRPAAHYNLGARIKGLFPAHRQAPPSRGRRPRRWRRGRRWKREGKAIGVFLGSQGPTANTAQHGRSP